MMVYNYTKKQYFILHCNKNYSLDAVLFFKPKNTNRWK